MKRGWSGGGGVVRGGGGSGLGGGGRIGVRGVGLVEVVKFWGGWRVGGGSLLLVKGGGGAGLGERGGWGGGGGFRGGGEGRPLCVECAVKEHDPNLTIQP